MITTGKNLGEIISKFGQIISERNPSYDDLGQLEDKLFIMANPKYGSEKKGAPTNYFLIVAPELIQVNCELNHVDVVLCCDPKAFTHCNPLEGLNKGGSLVWESSESPEVAWQRIPAKHRQFTRTITSAFSSCQALILRAKPPSARTFSCGCRVTPSSARFSKCRPS